MRSPIFIIRITKMKNVKGNFDDGCVYYNMFGNILNEKIYISINKNLIGCKRFIFTFGRFC